MSDYSERTYLSTVEVATYLGLKVKEVHQLIDNKVLEASVSTSGQYRVNLSDVKKIEAEYKKNIINNTEIEESFDIDINNTIQSILTKNSQDMNNIESNSIHLVVTSPPYFNAKMYSNEIIENDLGNIHNIDEWFCEINKVWKEVFRVLQPGRKFFLNIMNLPIRENNSYRTLNLVGKTIDFCESLGFIFKRDIVWHKTNGVRAHFGTYPYPGGIIINNMHEFILEFNKPDDKKFNKYSHLTNEIKEKSKLDKDFWLSIKNSDVWVMNPEKSGDGRKHIAPFPLELPYRIIKAFSFIGENVLDPFCGSGTTLIACANLGRNGIGYEINKNFSSIIKNRLLENIKDIERMKSIIE